MLPPLLARLSVIRRLSGTGVIDEEMMGALSAKITGIAGIASCAELLFLSYGEKLVTLNVHFMSR